MVFNTTSIIPDNIEEQHFLFSSPRGSEPAS
jgi:hypothetical protein